MVFDLCHASVRKPDKTIWVSKKKKDTKAEEDWWERDQHKEKIRRRQERRMIHYIHNGNVIMKPIMYN